MKYLYLALLLAVLSSCRRNKFAEISGTATGFTSGTLIIKDQDGHIKFSGNIEDGKFDFHLTVDTIGYYTMRIIKISAMQNRIPGYDIYLEPGTYTIAAEPETARRYPAITSSSETQTELSQYYAIANTQNAAVAKGLQQYSDAINDKSSSTDDIAKARNLRDSLLNQQEKNKIRALATYVGQYPQSKVAAHILSQLDYESNADDCYPIYQKFTDEQKKTADGIEEGDKLNGLKKLAPGNVAPQLAGVTIDGKPFDPQMVKGKITLVEFWTADNELSRDVHSKLLHDSFSPLKTYQNFTVVSVSLDTDPKVWKNAVSSGGLTWINISDLKGDDSPNEKNWQATKIPSYILVDGDWKIIKRNIGFNVLSEELQDYMDKNKIK